MSFDPNKKAEIAPKDEVVAVIESVIEKPRVPTLSPAERIDAARARSMQRSTNSRQSSDRHASGFYADQAGAGTSEYEFHHLIWRAEFFKLPRLFTDNAWLAGAALGHGKYDRKTGEWIRGTVSAGCDAPKNAPLGVSIHDLRNELNRYLQNFGGVSDALLEEFYTTSHAVEEHKQILNMTVAERAKHFRES
jgi:hypothetical protein